MIEKRVRAGGKVVYRVRYYGPDRRERSRSFRTRRDAAAFEAQTKSELSTGGWIDPARGRLTLEQLWELYSAGQAHLALTSQANYASAWKVRVRPQFGKWSIDRIGHGDVAAWVGTMQARGDSPDSVRYAHRVLSLLLDFAVRDQRLHRNNAKGVDLPKRPPGRARFLTFQQVHDLAERLDTWPVTENERRRNAHDRAMQSWRDRPHEGPGHGGKQRRKPMLSLLEVRPGYGSDVVLVFAYCGLRWSEMAALRVRDVDLAARRVRVVERTTEVGGRLNTAAPKSKKAREVAIPRTVAEVLTRRVNGRHPDDLVFTTPAGRPLRNLNWRRDVHWNQVCKELGLEGVTPHDLRRTFGSLARQAGADLRYIQKALGHSSITVTASIYAHLFDSELDQVSDALDELTATNREPSSGPDAAQERDADPSDDA